MSSGPGFSRPGGLRGDYGQLRRGEIDDYPGNPGLSCIRLLRPRADQRLETKLHALRESTMRKTQEGRPAERGEPLCRSMQRIALRPAGLATVDRRVVDPAVL